MKDELNSDAVSNWTSERKQVSLALRVPVLSCLAGGGHSPVSWLVEGAGRVSSLGSGDSVLDAAASQVAEPGLGFNVQLSSETGGTAAAVIHTQGRTAPSQS